MGAMVERAQILVSGIVQGVGFRPFVFHLAESLRLKGYVINSSEGVFIDIEGPNLADFVSRLRSEAPPLSQITDLLVTKFPCHGYLDFTIRHSLDERGDVPFTLVSPDVSICDDCLKELLDPGDRRYLYPFTNCTNCGPRYSITRSVPYDRPNTTMEYFTMCAECRKEYENPRDRRFHAQPNACAKCGPAVEFRVRSSECGVTGVAAMQESVKLLKRGGILAVKGLGGFHIACDASNDAAVRRLRTKKRKSNKPFAVMAPTIEAAKQCCLISEDEMKMLQSNRRPVVLLAKRPGDALSEAVSPNNQYLGVMLPYTPLHYLLFYHSLFDNKIEVPHFTALVMTSGNLSEEPIVRDNEEATAKLSPLVDGFLLHNRDIFMRVDDSVVRVRSFAPGVFERAGCPECGMRSEKTLPLPVPGSALYFIRRSRGYAPDPIYLHDDGPEVLACGADLKNTFTMTKGKFAIPSQHIGDMENYETVKFFEESLANIKAVYRADPKIIVHDLHPGYLSTQWAVERAARDEGRGTRDEKPGSSAIQLFGIQHHYAHIGSVMAEHGLKGKVIGVAFDGTGYGTDGHLWGGEFLIADVEGFERAGQLKYVPLPGGETAIREPWRTAVSLAMQAEGDKVQDVLEQIGFVRQYGKDVLKNVMIVASSRELSPLASGAGRLFDAVSALLGVCEQNSFEGESAMALEALTREGIEDGYPFELITRNGYTEVSFDASIRNIIADKLLCVSSEVIATRFHNTVASVIRTVVLDLKGRYGIEDVCLSGGTFQNLYLLNLIVAMLSSEGMNVFTNHKVPCNDGGISLGQAYLIRERLKKCGAQNADIPHPVPLPRRERG